MLLEDSFGSEFFVLFPALVLTAVCVYAESFHHRKLVSKDSKTERLFLGSRSSAREDYSCRLEEFD